MADSASVIAAGAASGGGGASANGLAGAIVVSEITPTTTAYINSGATVSINVGRVTVLADSGAVSALDTALGNLVKKSNNNLLASDTCTVAGGTGGQNCIDFSAAALNDGTGNGPGASIVSVAGLIQAGKNNVGASIVYNTIATTHSAYIANVLMTAGSNGNVSVSAVDSSKIQAVTIGFGLATGQFAGVGGTTISSISNTVSAAIGNSQSSTTQSSVTATNISVTATDNSSITGTAAVAGASTQGSAAGLALVYSSIANNVSAGVTGSKLTASGNVAVSANSNASISTVAVGIAMSSQVGLAGSVATNLMGTNVTASITAAGTNGINGADVTATNNVAVIAGNNDKAAVFAGAVSISKGAAGGAGSLVTNQITGTTAAYISGANTKVDALGTSTTDTLSVNNGTLVHAFDLGAAPCADRHHARSHREPGHRARPCRRRELAPGGRDQRRVGCREQRHRHHDQPDHQCDERGDQGLYRQRFHRHAPDLVDAGAADRGCRVELLLFRRVRCRHRGSDRQRRRRCHYHQHHDAARNVRLHHQFDCRRRAVVERDGRRRHREGQCRAGRVLDRDRLQHRLGRVERLPGDDGSLCRRWRADGRIADGERHQQHRHLLRERLRAPMAARPRSARRSWSRSLRTGPRPMSATNSTIRAMAPHTRPRSI